MCVFEVEAPELVGAVMRPSAWSSFRAYGKELADALTKFKDWKLVGVIREVNVPAFKIDRSVTLENRLHSYVAWGDPLWLRSLYKKEMEGIAASLRHEERKLHSRSLVKWV